MKIKEVKHRDLSFFLKEPKFSIPLAILVIFFISAFVVFTLNEDNWVGFLIMFAVLVAIMIVNYTYALKIKKYPVFIFSFLLIVLIQQFDFFLSTNLSQNLDIAYTVPLFILELIFFIMLLILRHQTLRIPNPRRHYD